MLLFSKSNPASGTKPASVIRKRLRIAALVTASSILIVGLSACDTRTTNPKPTTTARQTTAATTTATTVSTVAATSTAKPSPTPTIKATTSPTTTIQLSEPQLAYVTSVSSSSPATVQVDYVEMYYGEEAVAKAKADKSAIVEKDEKGNEYIANDYYLRNTNPQLRTFPLAAKCVIKVLPDDGGSDPTKSITVAQLRARVGTRKRLMEITFSPSGKEIAGLAEFFVP